MSKTGRLLMRSAMWRTASIVVAVITGMVLLPLILHHLGDRLYGAWTLVGVVLGYYGLLDLGLSSAISRFVSRALGQGDQDEADGIIAAGVYLFSAAGIISFAITAVVALLCGLFVSDPEEVILFRRVFLVMGVALGISFPVRCYRGVLDAHLRYDLNSMVEICSTLIHAGLFVWVLLCGGKLLSLALVVAAVGIIRAGAIIALAQYVHGRTKLSRSLVTRARVRRLFGYGFYTFFAQIADLLRRNVYPFIISGFLGLAAVTPYAIAERLKNVVVRISVSILLTVAPVFSRQEARGDEDAIRWTYFFTYKIACYIGVFLVGLLAMLGGDFVSRWVGDKYSNIVPILYILLVGCFFAVIQIPTVNFLYGTSRHRFFAITNCVEGITNVALSIILIRSYGLVGVALGMAIATVVAKLIILPFVVCRALNISLLRYYLCYTLPNVAKPIFFMIAIYVAAHYFFAADYVRLSVIAFVVFVLYVPYIFFVGFNKQERSLLLSAIRQSVSVRTTAKTQGGQE